MSALGEAVCGHPDHRRRARGRTNTRGRKTFVLLALWQHIIPFEIAKIWRDECCNTLARKSQVRSFSGVVEKYEHRPVLSRS